MAAKHGLGRGLGALIKDGTTEAAAAGAEAAGAKGDARRVPVSAIRRSSLQPRRRFDDQSLAELTASIRQRGVLQPLLVRPAGDGYELIAGERRLRASLAAGLPDVPVLVIRAADGEALETALVENLQREDLNVMEEAEGYQVLTERFGLTQEEVAARVGKARASVANTLRLLALPPEIRRLTAEGALSAGHAKILAGLEIEQEQLAYARRVLKENLSVRNLEKLVERARRAPRKPRASRDDIPASHIADLSDRLHRHFGTSVRLQSCRTMADGKTLPGSVAIDFYSSDDLDRILDKLGVNAE
ncbi:MAG: ParB/RepB/Spo0J family partition protein [Lentisphaerae bacterium]|nr:ParB/RepB/Spo0J family partition protein [Lentisphaerota bacterium]